MRDQESPLIPSAALGAGGGSATEGPGAPDGTDNVGATGDGGSAPGGHEAEVGGAGNVTGKVYDERYVKELREEAARRRTEAKELAARLKQLEEAQLSESEKRDRRLKELEGENQQLKAEYRRAAILAAAAAAGAIYPEAIVGLVPADADDVTAAVATLKREYVDLFRKQVPAPGNVDAGAGTGSDRKPIADMNTIIRRAAGRP